MSFVIKAFDSKADDNHCQSSNFTNSAIDISNFDKAKDVLPSKISKSASNLSCLGNLLFFKAKDNSLSFLSNRVSSIVEIICYSGKF